MRRPAPILGFAAAVWLAASAAAWGSEPGGGTPANDAHGKTDKPDGASAGKEQAEAGAPGKEPAAPPPRLGCYYDPNAAPPLSVHPSGDGRSPGPGAPDAAAKPEHAAGAEHDAAAKGKHAAPEAIANAKAGSDAHAAAARPEHAGSAEHDAAAKAEHAAPEAIAAANAASEAQAAEVTPKDAAPVPAIAGKHAKDAPTPIDDAPHYPAVPDTESTPPEPIHAAPAEPTHAALPDASQVAPTAPAETARPSITAQQPDPAPAPPADAAPGPAQAAPPELAQNDRDQPYALIRTLEAVQDKIASGSRDAQIYQRTLIAEIAKKLPKTTDAQWREPRNSRAAIIYTLSGGDPGVLAKLLSLSPVPCVDENLIRGLLDYSQGRNPDALGRLGKIDARTLDPRAGGHLALAQALLVATEDPKRAIGYLDQARLLAPGTLVEEAALRREVVIAAMAGDLEVFRRLTSQYLRRYNKSVYATDFIRRFASVVTTGKYGESPALFQSLAETLDSLGPEQRKFAYSAIAEASITRGEVKLTLLAAKKLADHARDDPKRGLQARLYEAAALLVTDDYEHAVAQLKTIDRAGLGARDRPLFDAALALSGRLRAPPAAAASGDPPPVSAEQGKSAELSKMPEVVDKAKQAFGKIDALLEGEKRWRVQPR